MAQNGSRGSDGQENSFTWNLNNVPISIEASGDLGRVVQDILPEIERRVRSHSQTSQAGNGTTASEVHTEQLQRPGMGHRHSLQGPPHRHHHHHHHHHSHTATRSLSEPEGPAGDPHSFVVNMGTENPLAGGGNLEPNQGGNGQQGGQPSAEQMQGLPTLRTLWKNTEGSVPFLLLLFAKTMYNHRLGILVLGALYGTFYHANSSLRKQIAQRDNSGSWVDAFGSLAWIITFLSANIFFIYFFFEEQELYKSLYLSQPVVAHWDLWNLLWVMGITDFVIKFGTIVVKTIVAMLPGLVLPYKKKGKYHMLVEAVSQLYRSIVPITPWVLFLLDDEHGGQWFSAFLLLIYAVCKGYHLWVKLKEVRKAYLKFHCDVSYGTVPDAEQMHGADNSCAICQDKFREPVLLSCKHIFCEDCVSMWFDRERTCPMCRANIVDNPVWRDGSTCGSVQLY